MQTLQLPDAAHSEEPIRNSSAQTKPTSYSPHLHVSEFGGETIASPNGESGDHEECQSNKADSIFDVDPFISPSLTAVDESKLVGPPLTSFR